MNIKRSLFTHDYSEMGKEDGEHFFHPGKARVCVLWVITCSSCSSGLERLAGLNVMKEDLHKQTTL